MHYFISRKIYLRNIWPSSLQEKLIMCAYFYLVWFRLHTEPKENFISPSRNSSTTLSISPEFFKVSVVHILWHRSDVFCQRIQNVRFKKSSTASSDITCTFALPSPLNPSFILTTAFLIKGYFLKVPQELPAISSLILKSSPFRQVYPLFRRLWMFFARLTLILHKT